MANLKFVKYKITLERVDEQPTKRREWKPINANGDYGYTPELDATEWITTEVLRMESREEVDLKEVVRAILKMERGANG